MRKNTFADYLRVEHTIIFMEKISFSLKLFSGHFMGKRSLILLEILRKLLSLIVINIVVVINSRLTV